MKFSYWCFSIIVMLSVCLGQEPETSSWNSGVARGALRFAVEVPLTNVAINTVPGGLTFKQSAQYIRETKGGVGFYSGAPVEILRSSLWYKRMQLMNDPWLMCVPTIEWEYGGNVGPTSINLGLAEGGKLTLQECDRNISIAANVAAFEMVFMPLFRLRNACMLSTIKEIQKNMMTSDFSLYSGGYLRGVATFVSWYSFFTAQDFSKEYLASYPVAQIGFVTATQMAVGAATAPLYIVMINRQKLTDPCTLSFLESARKTYQVQGSSVFIRTAKLGAVHAGVQAALTSGVMSIFEKK